MFKKVTLCFFFIFAMLILSFLLPAYSSSTKVIHEDNFIDTLVKRKEVPFRAHAMVRPGTTTKIAPDTIIDIPEKRKTVVKPVQNKNVNIEVKRRAVRMPARDYYGTLNKYENYCNKYGYSLRNTQHLGTTQKYNANYEKLNKDKQDAIRDRNEMRQRYGPYQFASIQDRIAILSNQNRIQTMTNKFNTYLNDLKNNKFLIVPSFISTKIATPPADDQIPILVNVMKHTKVKHFAAGDQDKIQVWYRNTVETEHSYEGNVRMFGESKIGATLWGWELNLVELSMNSILVNNQTASSQVVFKTIGNKINYLKPSKTNYGDNGVDGENLLNGRLWGGTFSFMAGPIPCYVEFGLDANLNIKWSYQLHRLVSYEEIQPSIVLNLVGIGSMGIDGIAAVGVGCNINILSFNYNIKAECAVEENAATPDIVKKYTLTAQYQVGGTITMLAGYAFLHYELLFIDGDVELFNWPGISPGWAWLIHESESDYGLIYDPDLAMQAAWLNKESKFGVNVQKRGTQLPNVVTLKFESRLPTQEPRGPHNVFFLYSLDGAEILKNNDPIGQQNFIYIFDGSDNETLITSHLPDLYSIKDIDVSLHDCPIDCDLDNTRTLNDGDVKNNKLRKSFVREADIGLGQLRIQYNVLYIPIDNFNYHYNIHQFELDEMYCQIKIYDPEQQNQNKYPVLLTEPLNLMRKLKEAPKPIEAKPEKPEPPWKEFIKFIIGELFNKPIQLGFETPPPQLFYEKNTEGAGARFTREVKLPFLNLPAVYMAKPLIVLTVSLVKKVGEQYVPIKDYCLENNTRWIEWKRD